MILERFAYLRKATIGWLYIGELRLATIERPWIPSRAGIGGTPRESCIPDGIYTVRPHTSKKFPNTYALINESLGVDYQQRPAGQSWGRTAILIHIGNTVDDVVGCIAVGLDHGFGYINVTNSRLAMGKLREHLGRTNSLIEIRPTGTQELVA